MYTEGTVLQDKNNGYQQAPSKMGMVFQHFNLFPIKTILQGVPTARLNSWENREEAGLRNGLTGLMGRERGERLSIPFSRATRSGVLPLFAHYSRCNAFDEPTSALDPEMMGEVLELMKKAPGTG